jgi:ABC-type branched-subunit amino acid transport system permease subunit
MNSKKFAPIGYGLLLLGLIAAPLLGAYPVFVMKLLCFALFASAFNLLLGYTGLLSFGHAAFLGGAAYVTGHAVKVWGTTPELGLLAGLLTGALLGLVMGWFWHRCCSLRRCRPSSPAVKTACRACRAASCLASSTCPATWPCTTCA